MVVIECVLGEDVVLVLGDDVQLIVGCVVQLEVWQLIYDSMDQVYYFCVLVCIEVLEDGYLVAEIGCWIGGWISQGMQIFYMGWYFVKWWLDELDWKIEVEIFVMIKCMGGMF